jgi:hypothetical protein
MRALGVALLALALVPAALASTSPARPVYDQQGRLIDTPFTPQAPKAYLTKERATKLFLQNDKVADWIARYPRDDQFVTEATYEAKYRDWTVKAWWGDAGQIALGRVDDFTGAVTEAWTGPQVAWKMARGGKGAFGGKKINSYEVWLGFCALFLLGLVDWRRVFSLRNLDLLVLVSFSASLWFFNRGEIFWSVPLVYPGLVYLLARMVWIGVRGRALNASRPLWPVWLLAAAAIFALGFRIGLNVRDSNVIDVGYAGVIGAQRIASGESPYGHFPVQDDRKPCGAADREGEIRERIQANGRCESSNDRGDTYGPVSYIAYLPGFWFFGWNGHWDDLPAAHFTAIAFDVLCMLGLALIGRRFGGNRLAATLGFAWAAYPFTQYVSNSNTNDSIVPAFLIWGFWLVSSSWARGAFAALASWTKFAPLLVVPMWATYPEWRRDVRTKWKFVAAFAIATAASFFVLLLEPNPLHAASTFYHRTIEWQIDRDSPFSVWGWGQYHARGVPDLAWVQHALQVLLVAGAIAATFWPRRKSPLQLAALTGALLIAFELVLTHWFYLYLPWFFGFVAFAVLAARPVVETAAARERETIRERPPGELVPTG